MLDGLNTPPWFTFQYASIKPETTRQYKVSFFKFTFQYASIKPKTEKIKTEKELDLHFNMLLLNQKQRDNTK